MPLLTKASATPDKLIVKEPEEQVPQKLKIMKLVAGLPTQHARGGSYHYNLRSGVRKRIQQ